MAPGLPGFPVLQHEDQVGLRGCYVSKPEEGYKIYTNNVTNLNPLFGHSGAGLSGP